MANADHLKIFKLGVPAWNHWRDLNRKKGILPNLSQAQLQGANLIGANLQDVDLNFAKLSAADLSQTNLTRAILRGADLAGANLTGADLWMTNLHGANVIGANLSNCTAGQTDFGDLDLGGVMSLETIRHGGPSTVGIDTIYKSKGRLPEAFLRGAGVPDNFIAYMHSLVAATFEFYSCFISYSSKDHEFAERLHIDLQSKGVRCWFAPEDLKIGDKLRPSFDEAIRQHDKLMVVLSQSSVKSPWVEKEVETAFEKERQQNRTVLFPIRLDDAVMETQQAWAADIRRTRHIGDFRKWKDHDSYKNAFERLVRDLKSEAKAESSASQNA
jgi:uncharacterized protein YjbI with pentapeptide repeats